MCRSTEIFSGITYNTDTNVLSFAIGYGSFAGFTNLTGPATLAHIHGPAPVTGTAAPIHDFFTPVNQHLFAPVPANGGVIIGTAILSAANETNLLNGQLYINIHTAANPAGEIRAQLINIGNPPTVTCPTATTIECTDHETPVELVANVADADGNALTVVWTIDGVAQPQINVPSGGATTNAQVTFEGDLEVGEHEVSLAVTDGVSVAVSCETTITIEDTVDPEITSIVATPDRLWPPNGKMKTAELDIEATDDCGEVTTKILSITSNQGTAADFEIVDGDTIKLRAKRAGGTEHIYTITVEAKDESGNTTTDTIEVKVPRNRGRFGR